MDRRAGIAGQFRDVIAYGAGRTDREHEQPVGDSSRSKPRHADAIAAADLERALADPDSLHGIAQPLVRWAAAFVLDPAQDLSKWSTFRFLKWRTFQFSLTR